MATSRSSHVCFATLFAYTLSKAFAPTLYAQPTCGKESRAPGLLFRLELFVIDLLWWLVLGILSSIGFGTGLHSGIMFLWPHVIQVINKAETCASTRFAASFNHPCVLHCLTTDDGSYTFLNTVLLLLPSVIFWGSGTAIGELPPYFITRAAKRAGKRAADLEDELAEARQKTDVISKLKVMTIDFTEKYGFGGILLLASWPNAAFDMCGMACGWLEVPFWTFFGATLFGKGFIKVTLQSLACVVLFGPDLFKAFIGILPAFPFPKKTCDAVGVGSEVACTLPAFLQGGRDKAKLTFALQERTQPTDLVDFVSGVLTKDDLVRKYCTVAGMAYAKGKWSDAAKHKQFVEKTRRVFGALDTSGDDKLSVEELAKAVSFSDSKVSLAGLDPGMGNLLSLGTLWNAFIVVLILFFVYSIIEQVAIQAQHSADSATLEAYEAALTAEAAAEVANKAKSASAKKARKSKTQ